MENALKEAFDKAEELATGVDVVLREGKKFCNRIKEEEGFSAGRERDGGGKNQ